MENNYPYLTMRYQRVIRHGTSLAIVIPAAMARELSLKRGDAIRLSLLAKRIPGESTSLFYVEVEPVANDEILANTQKDG